MTNPRPFLVIFTAVLLGGAVHAGELSLGGARMLAQAGTEGTVDVTVNFTDRGHAMREPAEGGDTSATTHNTRDLRGADAPVASSAEHRAHAPAPVAKATEAPAATTDSPHGISISPSAAIRRPSYRWQSLVPGTIK